LPDPFRLTAPKLTENDIESACLTLLRLRGYVPFRLHAGQFKSLDDRRHITGVEKGTPDWVALHGDYPGFLLECKRPGGKLNPDQIFRISVLETEYRLAVVTIDNVWDLQPWIDAHQKKSRGRGS